METLKFRHPFCNTLRQYYYNEIFNLHINYIILQNEWRVKKDCFFQPFLKNFRVKE